MPRMNPLARAAALTLMALSGAASTAAQAPATAPGVIDTLALRAHTRFLADDQLLGRGTGTPGEHIAAAYIVSQLTRLGMEPLAADSSFLLPIPLRSARVLPATQLTVARGAETSAFHHGADFIVNTGAHDAFRDFAGRALFFGQPIHAQPLVNSAHSLDGRVAVFLGPLAGNAVELVPALVRAGAAGIILLVPEQEQYDLYVRSRGAARYFVDADVDDAVWQPALPVLIAGPSLTDALTSNVAVSAAMMQGTARAPLDLDRTVSVQIRTDIAHVTAANVGGIIRGSDPARAAEVVAFTAHYDHLGVSTPDATGDSIYNGFSDNAAGVAMLLAIAQAMRDEPPARSVAFLFFTGEERGLLGSSFMAAHPPLQLNRVRALINLDAGAPPAPPVSFRIAGGTDTPLGATARTIAERNDWTATLSAASPNSDYWPFLQRDVPAIFIIPGDQWENITADERDALRRRWDRYHRADDHWHPDFPFAGLARYAHYALLIGREIADR
jgi:hypothetical protein